MLESEDGDEPTARKRGRPKKKAKGELRQAVVAALPVEEPSKIGGKRKAPKNEP